MTRKPMKESSEKHAVTLNLKRLLLPCLSVILIAISSGLWLGCAKSYAMKAAAIPIIKGDKQPIGGNYPDIKTLQTVRIEPDKWDKLLKRRNEALTVVCDFRSNPPVIDRAAINEIKTEIGANWSSEGSGSLGQGVESLFIECDQSAVMAVNNVKIEPDIIVYMQSTQINGAAATVLGISLTSGDVMWASVSQVRSRTIKANVKQYLPVDIDEIVFVPWGTIIGIIDTFVIGKDRTPDGKRKGLYFNIPFKARGDSYIGVALSEVP
jgi:hypothetical protein